MMISTGKLKQCSQYIFIYFKMNRSAREFVSSSTRVFDVLSRL